MTQPPKRMAPGNMQNIDDTLGVHHSPQSWGEAKDELSSHPTSLLPFVDNYLGGMFWEANDHLVDAQPGHKIPLIPGAGIANSIGREIIPRPDGFFG